MTRRAVGRHGDSLGAARHGNLRRHGSGLQIDDGDERVVLVRRIDLGPVGQDPDPVRGALGVDGLRHLARLRVEDEQLAIEIAGDVNHPVGSNLNPVRRAIRGDVDRADDLGRIHVDDQHLVARIRISVEDAVAVERHVGGLSIRGQHEVVRLGRHLNARPFLEGDRVEEADVAAHFIDEQQPASARRVIGIGHQRS